MNSSNQPAMNSIDETQAEQKKESQDQETLSTENLKVSRRLVNLKERLVLWVGWLLAISCVLTAMILGWRFKFGSPASAFFSNNTQTPAETSIEGIPEAEVDIPPFVLTISNLGVTRKPDLKTIIPSRPREEVIEYTVQQGDSVFAIAQNFNLKPETILWANFDQLQDSPDSLSVGMVLNVPPVDGVYYQWKTGDTLEGVAGYLKVDVSAILNYPGNKMDLTNPEIEVDQFIMVPGGEREFRSWIVPQIARGSAGVSKSVYGPGACEGSYEGLYGGGGFIWPSANHFLSGNDFWSGHLGIDLAGGVGDTVLASDSGVIVFAGWATGGYGYMIMIDHGNGYQSLYAHLSSVGVGCGQSVYQGNYIGAIGNTGNSTGSHLHFEVRLWGQFVNPWHVLP